MAMECEICGKKPMYGHNISHAHNVTSRRFNPNLQVVKMVLNGVSRKVRACTRCIRSGKILKPAKRQAPAAPASTAQ